jgi:hypothetical protein
MCRSLPSVHKGAVSLSAPSVPLQPLSTPHLCTLVPDARLPSTPRCGLSGPKRMPSRASWRFNILGGRDPGVSSIKEHRDQDGADGARVKRNRMQGL